MFVVCDERAARRDAPGGRLPRQDRAGLRPRRRSSGLEIVTARARRIARAADGSSGGSTRAAPRPRRHRHRRAISSTSSSGARVKEFVAEAPALARALRARRARCAWPSTSARTRIARPRRSCWAGGRQEERGLRHARRRGQRAAASRGGRGRRCPRTSAVLRDKTVVEFERDKVTRLEIESPRGAVTLRARRATLEDHRARRRCRPTRSRPAPCSHELRDIRRSGLSQRGRGGIPALPRQARGPGEHDQQGGAGPATVLLAPVAGEAGRPPSAYAAVAGRGPVVLVDASALTSLGRSVAELRDRTLSAGSSRRTSSACRVRRDGGQRRCSSAEAIRSGARRGRQGRGQGREGGRPALRVAGAEVEEIAAPTGNEPAKYGLDAPTLEVALLGRRQGAGASWSASGRATGVGQAGAAADVRRGRQAAREAPKVPDDFKG